MSKVADVALAAYWDREQQREREREARRAIHDEQEREKDAEALALVSRSPLAEWFPGERWVLCDRKFQQDSAVVTPEEDADDGLWFRVTRTTYPDAKPAQWLVSIVEQTERSTGLNPWRELRRVECPADVGDWLERKRHESVAVTAVSR